MCRLYRAILRKIAKNMFFPSLRMFLLRRSGVKIGSLAFVYMDVTFIDGYRKDAIIIGNRVVVAPGVTFVAEYNVFFSRLIQFESVQISGKIVVKKDAWIGANATILPNITIGECSIVCAGSVVKKDVDDYSIVAGNPAEKIEDVRNRIDWFDMDSTKKLL